MHIIYCDGGMMKLTEMPGHMIRRLNQHSAAIFQDRVRASGHDITSVQYAALAMLVDHPGIDQAGLAGLIAYDRATIGGVVQRLEQKGLLERRVDDQDRRARRLYLTPAGVTALQELTPVVGRVQADILANLSEDERLTLLTLIARAIRDKDTPDSSY